MFVLVSVVNMLVRGQPPVEMAFHDKAMLWDDPSVRESDAYVTPLT